MARRRNQQTERPQRRTPKVRLARPSGRPLQLRYTCPETNKEIRISTGTRDEAEAELQKQELEAKLMLGIPPSHKKELQLGPQMAWEDFREQYRLLHLDTLRETSAEDAEVRLDLAAKILRPRTLGDLAETNALSRLQARLLTGEGSVQRQKRSPHTVRSYMGAVLAAVNWAHAQGWLQEEVKLRRLNVSKQRTMKGRPITSDEFERMLAATNSVVGDEAADSWRYLLCGLWESGLRLGELMHVSWDVPNTIRPVWIEGQLPVLDIPAALQKNNTEECIPLLPDLESLLLETPEADRTGWVFQPESLQGKFHRAASDTRPTTKWVGRVVSRIGEQARVVVREADPSSGRAAKHASAHDLRRSCGQRLRDAGVPPLVLSGVLRHADFETTQKFYAPGNVQNDAKVLRRKLGG